MKMLLLVFLLPLVATASTIEVWLDHCGRCHGDDGSGHTKLGVKLHIKDYASKANQSLFTDAEALRVLQEGKIVDSKKVMPGYKDELSPEQLSDLVAYIRTLGKKP